MRYIFIIILLFSFSFTCSQSILDDIHKSPIETNWTKYDDYLKSDIIARSEGFSRDYGNYIFWKHQYWGWFIDKKDGGVFKKIEQDPIKSASVYYINWDLSPTDSSKIIGIKYGNRTGDTNYIIAFKHQETDTLFSWRTDENNLHPSEYYSPYFYAISDNHFLDQHGHRITDGPYSWRVIARNYINLNAPDSNKISHINEVNLFNFSSSDNNEIMIFSKDNTKYNYRGNYENPHTVEFMTYRNGEFNKKKSLDIHSSSLYNSILNDSICLTMYKDTVVLYNYNKFERYSIYPTQGNENPIGAYWNEDNKTVNVAFARQGDSCDIMSIHYPSKNVVKRERVVAPYLGRFVMNTGDGYTLSIGEGGFLYKHNLDIFKTDSLTAGFSFNNTSDYELQFSDESFGAVTDWQWDFGDGNTSNERNPIHKFASAGNYEVELIVTDEYGKKDTTIKQVKVTQKLEAQFDFGGFTGQAPFTVQFRNYSSDNSIRYIWNFGDGTYSYEMEPAHTYSLPGEYSISLTAVDEYENFNTFVQPKKVLVTE